ncbi:MAG TPA: hypothetical protein VKQ30_22340 [Ktedonobacterales bacterium]|jgi:hypothetical protein|nr:hypothetical protein [Ktedonobacterales bacterium]
MARLALEQSTSPQASLVSPRPVVSAEQSPRDGARPHPWEMVLHPVSSLRFMNALRHDPRISWVRKVLYVGPLLVLVVALLVPEGVVAAGIALLLPLVGPLINVPADAALDWIAFGLAAYALLGVFPRAIVREHHARLFHPTPSARRSSPA